MPFAISTVGQGSSVYLTMPACSINAGANTDVTGIEFDIKPIGGNAAGFFNIAGISSNNTTALRIEVATGILQWRYSGTVYLASAAGAAPMNERAKYGAEYEESTTSLYLTKNGVRIAGPYVAAANSLTTNIAWNQIGRVGTSSPSPQTFELYGVRTYGGNATYQAQWDETGASGTGGNWADDSATRNITITSATGAADSWWIYYGGVTQHQSTSGTATQAATSVADNSARNSQHRATTGTATQSAGKVADTTARNGQQRVTAGSTAQTTIAIATAEPLNNQHHQVTGTTAQEFAGTTDTTASNSQNKATAGNAAQIYTAQVSSTPLNNQHRQSAGQLLSVAGFIADTSWVNTVDLGDVQHRGTSGSAAQSATAKATTSALNNQHHQSRGTSAQAGTGTADTAASNSQHCQSAGQLRSVAGFIASTGWVNTVDLGNIQHRSTSGSTKQAASATAMSTTSNGQNRQSSGRGSAKCTATVSTSRVNTILQKAVYIRRIESRSITKKIYHTASRHKIELKTQSGGGYMQELNFKQGASALLQIEHTIDNEPVSGISEAKYELYGRTGQVLITKKLGDGIEFSEGLIEIQLTEDDTATLSASYNHQCVAKDLAGLKFYPLNGAITFGATKPRL